MTESSASKGEPGRARGHVARLDIVIAASFIGLAGLFALAITFSLARLRPVEGHVRDVLGNAAPSIEALTDVRTQLFHLWLQADDYVARSGDGRVASREAIAATRARIDAAMAEYRALPFFPDEPRVARLAIAELAVLYESLQKTLDRADTGNTRDAELELQRVLSPQFVRVADAMDEVIAVNSTGGRLAITKVLRSTRRANASAMFFGGASFVLALAGAFAAAIGLRARAHIVDENLRLLATRSSEMEAFAGRVSHDLKGPLSAIALRLMSARRKRDMDPESVAIFDKVAHQVEHMNSIIEALLAFASAGAHPDATACADLRVVMEEVVEDLRTAAAAVSTELRIDAFPSTLVACEPGALRSVLQNLLGNAVKYIVEGRDQPRRISVRVNAMDRAAHVAIEDTGPGMPRGSERIVFEPFRRLPGTKQSGTGLGLATVKKIVEAYNGRVGVESTEGHGSCFWFDLPRASARDAMLRGSVRAAG